MRRETLSRAHAVPAIARAAFLEQNDAIGVALKGRRSVVDVNPETGAADPSVPAPAEGQAAPGGDSSGGKAP